MTFSRLNCKLVSLPKKSLNFPKIFSKNIYLPSFLECPKANYSTSQNCKDNPIIEKDTRLNKQANVSKVRSDGKTVRFYKNVQVVKGNNNYEIELDGYSILSKNGKRLVLPSEMMAIGVASDWECFHEKVDPRRMYLYNLASLAIDLDDEIRMIHEDALLSNLKDDQLSFRYKDSNPEFKKLLDKIHNPIIEWFQSEFQLEFMIHDQYGNSVQPLQLRRKFQKAIESLDAFSLIGLVSLTDSTLSFLTSLAAWNGIISTEHAVNAVRIETMYFEKIYGSTEGSSDLRLQEQLCDVAASIFFLRSLPTEPLNNAYLQKILEIDEKEKLEFELNGTLPTLRSTRKSLQKFQMKQKLKSIKDVYENKVDDI